MFALAHSAPCAPANGLPRASPSRKAALSQSHGCFSEVSQPLVPQKPYDCRQTCGFTTPPVAVCSQATHATPRSSSPSPIPSTAELLGIEVPIFSRRANLDDESLDLYDDAQHVGPACVPRAHAISSNPSSTASKQFVYKRVMLKISGEALQGQGFGVDPLVLQGVAEEIAEAHTAGLEVAVVVGGGNYFRGANAWKGLDRAQADYVGMLATVMNALLLQGALEAIGVDTRVQTAIEMREVAEPYIRRRAIRHLTERKVVIFGAGTGNPFFTTDTAAALRAAEMNCQVFMKATKVDGVYDSDPKLNRSARKYDKLSYRDVSLNNLQVMDETAITLCKENNIPVIVFNVNDKGNVLKAAMGQNVGTVVDSEESLANLNITMQQLWDAHEDLSGHTTVGRTTNRRASGDEQHY